MLILLQLSDFREYDLSFKMNENFSNPWINMNCTYPRFNEIQCSANAKSNSPSDVRKGDFGYYFYNLGMIKERSIPELNLFTNITYDRIL